MITIKLLGKIIGWPLMLVGGFANATGWLAAFFVAARFIPNPCPVTTYVGYYIASLAGIYAVSFGVLAFGALLAQPGNE
jgi:uncharacterized membrane protein required for colicin V production